MAASSSTYHCCWLCGCCDCCCWWGCSWYAAPACCCSCCCCIESCCGWSPDTGGCLLSWPTRDARSITPGLHKLLLPLRGCSFDWPASAAAVSETAVLPPRHSPCCCTSCTSSRGYLAPLKLHSAGIANRHGAGWPLLPAPSRLLLSSAAASALQHGSPPASPAAAWQPATGLPAVPSALHGLLLLHPQQRCCPQLRQHSCRLQQPAPAAAATSLTPSTLLWFWSVCAKWLQPACQGKPSAASFSAAVAPEVRTTS